MNFSIKRLTFSIIFTAIFLTSCTRADFEFNETEGYFAVPSEVRITNLSDNAEDYLWDYGDGTTSGVTNPRHTYEEAGTYTVTLTAISKRGRERTTSKEITIHEAPEKVFIKGATVYSAPLKDFQGNNWDDESEGNLPDIFVEINNGVSVIYATTEEQVITDVDAERFPLSFTFNNGYEIPKANFGKRYYFDVEDKDSPTNKIIGYKIFTVNQLTTSQTKFPYTILLENDDIKAELILEYE